MWCEDAYALRWLTGTCDVITNPIPDTRRVYYLLGNIYIRIAAYAPPQAIASTSGTVTPRPMPSTSLTEKAADGREAEEEYRVVQRYLGELESSGVYVVYFSYSLPAERQLKAVRGVPADTEPEAIMTELRDLGFEPEHSQPIRARKGRPGCIFLVILRRTPDLTPAIYNVKELLCIPGVTIESWRGKRGPAQCHRCQGFRHSSHQCHRAIACVRSGEGHRTADCPPAKGGNAEVRQL
ncbi:unnamed protein product [Pieris macdunnoughi]|uniref:Nucleic-acid-binding protein from transposon X-element n=1 Tax=Pieris macdunnoughi TaxID=345717 RepID=A0A821UKI0_9NEOP|nr:unnamed protein product [Pieris macdunnoughi]